MRILRDISILFLVQFFFYIQLQGQFKSRISLEITDVKYNKGNLIVKYNINNSKQKDKIRVWISIFNSKNDTIFAKSWNGDVNKFISGGNDKVAIWNIKKDGIDIIDSISVKLSASIQNGLYLDNPFVLSTIFPGWGDYQIKPRKPYWIYGALAYSFLGSSMYLHNSSSNDYDNYLNAETITDKDNYYNKAKTQNTLSYALFGAAGVIWAIDYIGLIKRTREIKKSWKKIYPTEETPNIPSFKIVTALSPRVFINTYLTNLQLVDNSLSYIDIDENYCLDAFEQGFLTFKLKNMGPAKAVNFYATVESSDITGNIKFPKQVNIENIPINQSRLVKIPIKATKYIKSGKVEFSINVGADHNNPIPQFKLKIATCDFHYNEKINRQTLVSDIDKYIPAVSRPDKRKYALIIGNEGYANESTGLSHNFNVPFARNDALIFKEYAIKFLGVPTKNITLLLDASKKEMRESIITLSKLVSKIKEKDQAQVIFYYAGHGLADTTTKAPHLMPVDIPPSQISNAIPMEFLYKKIWESRSTKSLVVIDASFNNGGRKIGLLGPSIKNVNPRKEVISGNTIVFMAISEMHTSNAYAVKKHGLFTYYFLKTLKESRGRINLLTLSNSIKTNVGLKAQELGHHQVPITLVSIAIRDIWQDWKVQ
ncbi:MAG: caspase family protein [Bacteroidota bacterium]